MVAALGGWRARGELDIGTTEHFVNHQSVMKKSWILYFFLLNFHKNCLELLISLVTGIKVSTIIFYRD